MRLTRPQAPQARLRRNYLFFIKTAKFWHKFSKKLAVFLYFNAFKY
jgi:hypothetical protein